MVISRPSRIHATPSAITSLVWNFDQGSLSIRAGIRLRICGLSVVVVADVVAMRLLLGLSPAPCFTALPRSFRPLLPQCFGYTSPSHLHRTRFRHATAASWRNTAHLI